MSTTISLEEDNYRYSKGLLLANVYLKDNVFILLNFYSTFFAELNNLPGFNPLSFNAH